MITTLNYLLDAMVMITVLLICYKCILYLLKVLCTYYTSNQISIDIMDMISY